MLNLQQYNQDNVFFRIIKGLLTAKIIHETPYFLAFPDIAPQAKHHIICIPKEQFIDFSHVAANNPSLMIGMTNFIFEVVKKVGIQNYRLVTNCGTNAGQSVMHFHMHILSNGTDVLHNAMC